MWRVQDGFFPSNPNWVSQTADGYLLVGGDTIDTLRFDGVRFVPWSSPAVISNRVGYLFPSKSGGFWISDHRGLSHIRGNVVVSHFDLSATALVEEENGSVWVVANRTAPRGEEALLCHATDREVKCFGKAEGLTIRQGSSILEDGTGGFWIGGDTSLVHWKAGASEVYAPPALSSNSGQLGIQSLVRNSDGSLWVGIGAAGRGLGLERFNHGTFTPFAAPNFDSTKIVVDALLSDRDGSLWVATWNRGLYRIHDNVVDRFGMEDGLSSNAVLSLYEDQEGGIWAVTSNGLDSFMEPRVTTYSMREGMGSVGAFSVIASRDGTVWFAGTDSLDSIRGNTFTSVGRKGGLPGNQVASLLEDRGGHLWVGVDDELYVYESRHFRRIPGPNGSPMGLVVGITEDVDGNIWAECSSNPRKLVRIRDFRVKEQFLDSQVPSGHALTADPRGGIWLGTVDGKLVNLRNGKFSAFPMNLKGHPVVYQIAVQENGSLMAAAPEDGLISLRAGMVELLNKQNGLPCDGVLGFVRDDRKNWWLSTPCGYVELADSEIRKWQADPKAVLQFRLLDALDGARTKQTPFNPAAKSPDGRLWFADRAVAQMIDPARLEEEDSVPRPVDVESITADHKQYPAQDSLKLPTLTHDLQIDYTSPSFANPQKVKFRYRLEGSDSRWQDADTRRQAFYNNLGPGQYRFTVMVSNEDGVWNTKAATLEFSIAPAWFQTMWFRALCVVAFFGLLFSLYWMRLRQVQSNERNLSLIVDTIPGLVVRMSAAGEVELANRQLLEYFGKELHEIRNWISSGVVHPEDLSRAIEIAGNSFATGDPYNMEIRVRRHDGVYRWFQARGIPLRDAEGRILNWYALHTDIDDRKRVEEALRASELNARMIVDGIPGLVARVSPAGQVEVVNRPLLEYFGKDLEEVRNWAITDAIHPEDLPIAMKVFNKSLPAGDPFDVEHRLRRFDGAYRWFQSRGLPLRDSDGQILNWYVLLTDIEDRKRAEEALQSNERNLSLIINTMPTLAWSARPDGSAEFLNQHYLDYVGLPLEKLQGWGWTTAVHPEDLKPLSGVWQSIMTAGKPGEAEARLRRFDGEFRWFLFRTNPMRDESGQIVKWYGTNTDIHDRKRAEAEVKESYLRLAEAQQLSKTGSFITDLVADQHDWSEETFRIFDFDSGTKVTVEMIRAGIRPEDLPSFDSMIARAMTGKDVDFSFRFVTAKGAVKHIRGMARVIEHIAGRPLFIGALQDVTESKVAEEALSRARSDLAHVSRVTTLNALTASIAHEINQPLSGIVTNANTCLWLLSTDPPDVDGARETAQLMIRDGNRASDVIERLRTLYGKKDSRPESMDLNEATREVISLSLSDLQRSRIIVHHEFADDLPPVTGDRIQIQQVILNLIRNASDAMSRIDDRPRELLITTERDEDNLVRLSVKDVGVGFQPQASDRLFEAFYTTKEHGMGIGLNVSRSIIRAHHGHLWATANDGPGATFSFSIPCSVARAGTDANRNGKKQG
jgi:PAS domain S-box-containing protein